ncbi:hypothetical protein F5141DRAFT_1094406 [Pisolithus sp. B1]|nr:hypothetical protein F5141DRAFT_1094406 [Pisolithus sp. B1]
MPSTTLLTSSAIVVCMFTRPCTLRTRARPPRQSLRVNRLVVSGTGPPIAPPDCLSFGQHLTLWLQLVHGQGRSISWSSN